MEKELISSRQLASLLFAFMTGSAIVNIPAPLAAAANNMAWLAFLFAYTPGFLLLLCLLYLNRQYPGLTYVQYGRKALGNRLTVLIVIPFLLEVMLMLANIVLDIGLFFKSALMQETPLYIFNGMIFLIVALSTRAGIEVMSRLFLLFSLVVMLFILANLFLITPDIRFEFLLPFLPDGIKPVLKGAYITWGFPNAEIVLFAMIIAFCRPGEKKLNQHVIYGFLVSGFFLLLVILLTTVVLGPLAGDYKYPIFIFARLIEVHDTITRIEALISMVWMVGSYMKASIVLFVANIMLTQLVNLKDQRVFIHPLAFIAFLLSLTMYKHEWEFVEIVEIVEPVLTTITKVLPIVLIALLTRFRISLAKTKG